MAFKPVRYMGATVSPTSGLRAQGATYDTGWSATCPECGWEMWGRYASEVRSSVRDHHGTRWCAERAQEAFPDFTPEGKDLVRRVLASTDLVITIEQGRRA